MRLLYILPIVLLISCSNQRSQVKHFDDFNDLALTLDMNPNMCEARNFCSGKTYMSMEAISNKIGASLDDWKKSAEKSYIKYHIVLNDGMDIEVGSFPSGIKLVSISQ